MKILRLDKYEFCYLTSNYNVNNTINFYKSTIREIWGHKINKRETKLCSHCGINNILACLRQTTIYYDLLFAQKPKKLLPAVLCIK